MQSTFQTKAQQRTFSFCAVALSIYIAYISYFAQSPFLQSLPETVGALLYFGLFSFLLYKTLTGLCFRYVKPLYTPSVAQHFSPRFFCLSALLAFGILCIAFMAYYPGGVSYDAYNQWQQVQTGQYNNWHPMGHTLMIALLTTLCNHYAFVVFIQIILFSLAFAYLLTTIHRYGTSAWLLLLLEGVLVASEGVSHTLLYVWKDNIMTIAMVILCAYSVRIYHSRGKWLAKPLHVGLLGLCFSIPMIVRHNGVLAVLPLFLCLLCCVGKYRKKLGITALVWVLCLGMMSYVYTQFDVVYPNNTLEESVGLPMTLLCNQKQLDESRLSDETNAFLNELATPETWQTVYRQNDYNSIKFTYPREYIKYVDPALLFRMVTDTALSNPRLAFTTFNNVTDIVWGIQGENVGYSPLRNSGHLSSAPKQNSTRNQLGSVGLSLLRAPLSALPFTYLLQNIGVQLLILLLCTLYALYRKGVIALVFVVPILVYHLATMLLLCGNDARFFAFSLVTMLPSALVLIRK